MSTSTSPNYTAAMNALEPVRELIRGLQATLDEAESLFATANDAYDVNDPTNGSRFGQVATAARVKVNTYLQGPDFTRLQNDNGVKGQVFTNLNGLHMRFHQQQVQHEQRLAAQEQARRKAAQDAQRAAEAQAAYDEDTRQQKLRLGLPV